MPLSDKDLSNIKKLIEISLEEKVPEIVKNELKKELSHLPNKDEFFAAMDKISGELKKMRETYGLASPKISDHETRITDLENIHPQGKHAFA